MIEGVSIGAPSEAQRDVCIAQGCDYSPVSGQDKVGVALSTLGATPINGLRHPASGDGTGWFIWCGEHLSEAPEFFQVLCIDHLIEKIPAVSEFLALPPGYRFLTDGSYRDIWFDEKLLQA